MKALLRGFLTGFGFALGASVAGTLIGYTIGRIGEASVKRLLSPEPTPPTPPTSSDIPAYHRERLIEQGWRLGYAARGDEQETDEQRRIDESRWPAHYTDCTDECLDKWASSERCEHDVLIRGTWTPSMRRLAQGHREGFHEQMSYWECPLCHPAEHHKSNYDATADPASPDARYQQELNALHGQALRENAPHNAAYDVAGAAGTDGPRDRPSHDGPGAPVAPRAVPQGGEK